ncbi:hypothetical protein [Maribacter sp. 2308TA10-17]|uniref:hypothetical protein n=1 Tax=Maribacter sp. 2308TA10-17 TaxID=3386276 RepID=UPI0039BD525C
MEQAITIAVYIHAFFGGLGLITGIGSMAVKKGGKLHKRMGKVFSISMITSCIIIIPIAWMPGHESLFLFLISMFTIYLVLIGRRALSFKSRQKIKADSIDLGISTAMMVFSLFMLGYGIYGLFASVPDNVLYMVFGGLGLFLTRKNFLFYKNFKTNKVAWLLAHLTHMIAGMIASITAFIVAGLKLWTITAWVLPSVIGTIYIIYWRRRTEGKIGSRKTS